MKGITLIFSLLSVSLLASVYMIDASFNSTNLSIDATEIVHWENPLSFSTSLALFNLFPNLHEEKNPYLSPIAQRNARGWIDVENVWVDGKKASFTVKQSFVHMYQRYSKDKTLLSVDLRRDVLPGQEVEIKIRFKTKFPEEGEDEGCFGGLCLWRFGWYPLEVYARNGRYYDGMVYTPHKCRLKISTPKGWDVAFHEGTGMGCPVAFLRNYDKYKLVGENYTVVVHHFKGLKDKAMKIAAMTLHALQEYSKRFGKLSYKTIHVIQSPYSRLFGMTAPGIITLGDNAFTTSDLILPGFTTPLEEFLVYHETAHLWFGIGASVDFESSNFLSESLAQYSAITQMEEERGATENLYESQLPDVLVGSLKRLFYFKSLREDYSYYYREMNREGIDWSVEGKAKFLNQEFPRNYAKGYFAFRTLALLFSNFDDVLKEYHKRFDGKVVTYEDFKRFILAKNPRVETALKVLFEDKGGIDAKVVPKEKGVFIDVPEGVPYKVKLSRGSSEVTLTLSNATTLKGNFDRVDIDPDWALPDPDRFNNHYPVLVRNPFKEEESPLEAYDIIFNAVSGYTSESDMYTSLALGIRKFDEYAVSFLSGSRYTIVGTDLKYKGSVYGVSSMYSPNPYIRLSELYLGNPMPLQVQISGAFTFPESVNIGYDEKYLTTRNYFYIGMNYSEDLDTWGEYDFIDLDKNSLAFGVYGDYEIFRKNWFTESQISYFPTDLLSISAIGIYSNSPMQMYSASYTAFGVAQLGFHLDLDKGRRTNVMNLFSFRGVHLSLKPGIEFGYGKDLDVFGTLELDTTLKIFTILDTPSPIGIRLKAIFDKNAKFLGIYYSFGTSYEDMVLTLSKLNISFLSSPPLKSHSHLSQLGF